MPVLIAWPPSKSLIQWPVHACQIPGRWLFYLTIAAQGSSDYVGRHELAVTGTVVETAGTTLRASLSRSMCCCRKGGRYFHKRDRGFYQHERPHFLAVEDPQDVTNDLARGSYNIEKVAPPLCPQSSSDCSLWFLAEPTPESSASCSYPQ